MKKLDIAGVRSLLAGACVDAGGQQAFAEQNMISKSYVSDVLHGRREPGQSMLEALGLERVVRYRRTS